MTSVLENKRKAWNVIFNDPHLTLNSLRQRGISGTVCQNGLRSVCWKIFLGYLPTLDVSSWSTILSKERQYYLDLKRKYIDEPTEKMKMKSEEDLTDNNPLSLNDSNPWQQFFADSEIKKVIRQDVERTFPDVEFFRENEIQERLTDMLFIYCKSNQLSYRQGMHELLAPFYWVLSLESIDRSKLDESELDSTTDIILQVLDSVSVEHDAYILFEKLMVTGKSWYEFNEETIPRKPVQQKPKDILLNNSIPKPTESAKLNPVVMICHRIHHQYLRTIDPLLYRHLESFDIEPQLYGLRWIRLLFGREFDIYELLKLWDAMFAQDPRLEIVEYVCLSILLRMRDQLLEKEDAECLSILMRPPQITKPSSLVEQAKDLKENMSQETALHILQQNDVRSGKEPRQALTESRSSLQHKTSQGFDSLSRIVMKNPQVRDLNRAIAGVMGTVQKNVNSFGENVLGKEPIIQRTKVEKATMGDLMGQCITILETELFEAPERDEGRLITALMGLKHVRDVLNGKTQFDPTVIKPSTNESWEFIDKVQVKTNKQNIKYRIEDLLSDPDLQLPSPQKVSSGSTRFKWILENPGQEDVKTSDELFKETRSPRKRASFIKKTVGVESDPLDVKNLENRKLYDLF